MKDNTNKKQLSVMMRVIIGLALSAVLVGIDQLTKWLVVSNMNLHDCIHLIKSGDTQWLNISYYLNDGAAFSLFEGQTTMFIVITSLMIVGMITAMLLKKVKRTPYIIAFSLIIGGGIGNLIDRIFNDGNVIDFIDVRIINFAIFNFADICAVCGGILLCIMVIIDEINDFRKKKREKAENAENADSPDTSEESVNSEDIAEMVSEINETAETSDNDITEQETADGND